MTIELKIRYFAKFRDLAGTSEELIRTEVDTAEALFAELSDRLEISEPQQHCKLAINDVLADWSASLSDGDEVLLFPPVAGG